MAEARLLVGFTSPKEGAEIDIHPRVKDRVSHLDRGWWVPSGWHCLVDCSSAARNLYLDCNEHWIKLKLRTALTFKISLEEMTELAWLKGCAAAIKNQ